MSVDSERATRRLADAAMTPAVDADFRDMMALLGEQVSRCLVEGTMDRAVKMLGPLKPYDPLRSRFADPQWPSWLPPVPSRWLAPWGGGR